MAAIEFDHPRGDSAQKGPVVSDEEKRPAISQQEFLQPHDGIQVQMIGRFIEKNQVGLSEEDLGEQDAPPGSAREGGEIRCGIEMEPTENLSGLQILFRVGWVGANDIENIALQMGGDLLGQASDPEMGRVDDLPFVGRGIAGENPEERAFAGPVDSEQSDPVAALDVEINGIDEGPPPIANADIAET
jgi:hypothetical protein